MVRRLVRLVVIAIALLAGYAALSLLVLPGAVNGGTLYRAVETAAGTAGPLGILGDSDRCTPRRSPRQWQCVVPDSEGSGGAMYHVVVERTGSCFSGRLTLASQEASMPRRISGCIHRWQPQL